MVIRGPRSPVDLLVSAVRQTRLWNTPAGDDVPAALARVLDINIVVVESGHIEELYPGDRPTLYLRRVNGNHYQAYGEAPGRTAGASADATTPTRPSASSESGRDVTGRPAGVLADAVTPVGVRPESAAGIEAVGPDVLSWLDQPDQPDWVASRRFFAAHHQAIVDAAPALRDIVAQLPEDGRDRVNDRLAVHAALATLAAHGWLEDGYLYLTETQPHARRRQLIEAVSAADEEVLLAHAWLSRRVATVPSERAVGTVLHAVPRALGGDVAGARSLVRTVAGHLLTIRYDLLRQLHRLAESLPEHRPALMALAKSIVDCGPRPRL
jgi:hypothetical protein